MKIALVMSGQPRYVEQAFPNIYRSIIEPNNPDIYCHCWYSKEQEDKPFRYGRGWQDQRITADAPEKILKLYKPKAFLYEPQRLFEDDIRLSKVDFTKSLAAGYAGGAENPECANYYKFATFSMWYSIYKSYILFSHIYNQYDVIIKCRYDLGINKIVKISDYDTHATIWHESLGRPELMNNWFNFGDRKSMYHILSMYNNLIEIYQTTGLWCNEYFTKYTCDLNNIRIQSDGFGLSLPSFPL